MLRVALAPVAVTALSAWEPCRIPAGQGLRSEEVRWEPSRELPARRLASVVSAGYRLVSVTFALMSGGRMLTPAGNCLLASCIKS